MASLQKFKLVSLLVLFFFSFQILGLPNLAQAVTAASVAAPSDDPLITCSVKARSIITNLRSIQDGLRRGEDQTSRLSAVSSEMKEILALQGAVEAKLTEIDGKLQQDGQIPEQIRDRHIDVTNKAIDSFTDLGKIAATLDELINRGNILADELEPIAGAMEKIAPQPEPEITSCSHELPHRRSDIEKRRLERRHPIDSGITPPGPQDLTPTKDIQITPEIVDLANKLDNDPVEIFRYVKNKIDYQPYFGSVKGALGTFWEKAGNDVDQASFLIALFRAANIPARYVSGEVKLNIHRIMNWTGAKTPEAALRMLKNLGIPLEEITGEDGSITHLKIFHTWVTAYIFHGYYSYHGNSCAKIHRWTQMDPSFKKYVYRHGINLEEAMGFDLESLYNAAISGATINHEQYFVTNLNEANIKVSLDNYGNNLMNWVHANLPRGIVGDVLGYRKIKENHIEHLHHHHQTYHFDTSSPQMEMSELPTSWRYQANFQMNGFSYDISLPEVYAKRLSLVFVPATVADQQLIDSYDGIFNVPAYLVNMKPQLKLEGQVVAEGLAVMLGSFQNFKSQFLRPWETAWKTTDRWMKTGADYSVFLHHQRISLDLLNQRLQNFSDLISGLPEGKITQDMVEEALHLTGMVYYAETEMHWDIAGKISQVTWIREPSQAFLNRDITVWVTWGGVPVFVKRASVGIDVKRTVLSYSSVTNNAQDEFSWMVSSGSMSSATEHSVFEQLYGIESVSSVKILALANKWGIPIYHIDRNNIDRVLPLLSATDIVKENISNYVLNYGWAVFVPQQEIQLNLWRGQGWIVRDPTTGNSGYFIAGGLISGSEVTAGGNGTLIVQDIIIPQVLEGISKAKNILSSIAGTAAALATIGYRAYAIFAAAKGTISFAVALGIALTPGTLVIAIGVGLLVFATIHLMMGATILQRKLYASSIGWISFS